MSLTNAEIIALGASELAAAISNKQLTARQAIEAYIERIETVNPKLNAVVLTRFAEARREADEADAKQARGESLGLLHGVPITIKETFDLAGHATTFGITTMRDENYKAEKDATMVRQLREAGAIVLGKTNIPQLAFYIEADNPVFGRTNNPWNMNRSPMGSTGGEAAIVAAGGSALGLASDLGGSARVPAFACGIQSIKTTSYRLSAIGHPSATPGQESLAIDFGTMARRVADLKLSLQVLISPELAEEDTSLLPISSPQWDTVDVRQMRIGFYTDNDIMRASPAIRRAVHEAIDVLRQQGAEVIEITPQSAYEALRIYQGSVTAGKYKTIKAYLKDSQIDWRMASQLLTVGLPKPIRYITVALFKALGQKHLASNVQVVGTGFKTADYWNLINDRNLYRQNFIDMMNEKQLDAIICPPYGVPAFRHGTNIGKLKEISHLCLNVSIAASYAYPYNVLGTPTGIVTTTRVGHDEETDRPASRDLVERIARDMELESAGLPIGVQVVGRHWREDVVLAIMATLEDHFGAPSLPKL